MTKVSEFIFEKISKTVPLSKDAVAAHLNVTPRTMTRKLKQEGFSYQEIVENAKRDFAVNALKKSTKSISQIGFDLGFKEPQAFARAFKRWTGITASTYRNKVAE